MPKDSIREYAEMMQGLYIRVLKMAKSEIFDEFTRMIGCYCKVATSL
jgi:hypothetical protein